jgi:hypothetical protein
MVNTAIIVVLVVAAFAAFFIPPIAGAIIARRAFKRWNWPEAKLAFFAFASMPLLWMLSAVTLPLVVWIQGAVTDSDVVGLGLMRWTSNVFAAANAVAIVAIAVSLYRLARRTAQTGDDPPQSSVIDLSGSERPAGAP